MSRARVSCTCLVHVSGACVSCMLASLSRIAFLHSWMYDSRVARASTPKIKAANKQGYTCGDRSRCPYENPALEDPAM